MGDSNRILIIDDDQSICEVLRISLKREGYQVNVLSNPAEGLAEFRKNPYDLVIQDIKMPQMDGIDLLQALKKARPETPVVIITAFSTWDRAVQAMRLGAYDYIRKPFDMTLDIKATVKRALSARHNAQIDQSETLILNRLGFVIGYSRQMKQVWDLVRKAANTDSTVLITGASGSGKELVARSLHFLSARAEEQFVAINCGAIPEQLLESELFGHVKGSFTDAYQDRVGFIEMAERGTVFLDEISEMSPKLQVKLLRVLEEREYRPVGGGHAKKADVRFITATNKDLEKEVPDRFREDLYYRLNVIPIRLPSLAERPEDIPLLSEYFLRKYAKEEGRAARSFTDKAKAALQEYLWPGNIRELENFVQRAVALADREAIDVDDLFGIAPQRKADRREPPSHRELTPLGINLDEKVRDLEVDYFRKALEMAEGNQTKAARLLGMSLSSFRHKLQKYGLAKLGPDR
jgi:two-component system response regulator PilR (NtrC family)